MGEGARSSRAERLAPALYNALLHAALPLIAPYYLGLGITRGKYLDVLPERMGWRPPDPAPPPGSVWLHAVSVGEVLAARTLARSIASAAPAPLVLSATTAAGLALARSAAAKGELAGALASPLDLPGAVRRAFDRLAPRALVLIEAEIWPNWLAEARTRRVPAALVNARITARSFSRYHRARALFRPLFAGLAAVGARSEADAERAHALGCPSERIAVTGDVKFDAGPPARGREAERAELGLPAHGFVVVAGSVLEKEDAAVVAAFRALLRERPQAVLVLAPRRSFAAPAAAGGLVLVRRTERKPVPAGGVLLLDTIGELKDAYAAADVAFVGGSLVPAGGHNLLEPASAGVPVLFGPHTANFADVAERLAAAGGGVRVDGPEQLARELLRLSGDAGARARAGASGEAVAASGRGSVQRTVRLLAGALGWGGERE